jgi:hypothetical protein
MPKRKTVGNPLESWEELKEILPAMQAKLHAELAAMDKVHAMNGKAKAFINRHVMGGMSKVKLTETEPTVEAMQAGLSNALNAIKMRIGMEFYEEWSKKGVNEDKVIFDNRMPDGAKFSRWFIRYRKQTRNQPRFKRLTDEVYRELPALPVAEDRSVTVEVFIQNFYNELKSMGGSIWLSTRPADLFTISDHDCTWGSCTRWNGEYSVSTITYCMDPGSAVLFFKNGHKKIGRCMVYFSTEHKDKITNFSLQRKYGTVPEGNLELARKRIQTLIARNSGISDKWKYRSGVGLTNIRRDGDTPYIDSPVYQSRHAELSRHYDVHLHFPVPVCLDCGREHDATSSMVCYHCRTSYVACRVCGANVSIRHGIHGTNHLNQVFCRAPECQEIAQTETRRHMERLDRRWRELHAPTTTTATGTMRTATGTFTYATYNSPF